jgi:Fe-S-cluster containining protein
MPNCCQVPDIYVTQGDVRRIEDASGARDFYEFRVSADPVYLDQDDDPVWRENVIREDGSRRILKHEAKGDCIFLGPRGCVLSVEARPLVCRLYPFDYNEGGIFEELASGCPLHLLEPGRNLIQVLGMNLEDARRWHRQLYEEIRRENVAPCVLV